MAKEEHEVEEAAGTADGGSAAREEAGAQAAGDEGSLHEAVAGTPDGESAVHETGTGAPDGQDAAGKDGADDAQVRSVEPDASPSMEPEDALAEARRAAQEHLDRALRAQAELENVRRRAERDLAQAHKFALERFVSELLPVKDSLELGLAASAEKGATAAGIAEGVELTLRMFEQAMEKFGVEPVDPAGDPFNPEFHQAMTMQESDTAESGTVLTVVQKGYLLNERLVRPAMVIVAK